MRRLKYTLALDSEGYSVMSYKGFCSSSSLSVEDYLPIKMDVLTCHNSTRDISIINIATVTFEDADKGFRQHYRDILRGKNQDWVLVKFSVQARGLRLEFFNRKTRKMEHLDLDMIKAGPQPTVNLKFSVPHGDDRPNTEYTVFMTDGRPGQIPVMISEDERGTHRTVAFENGKGCNDIFDMPVLAKITEYVDL